MPLGAPPPTTDAIDPEHLGLHLRADRPDDPVEAVEAAKELDPERAMIEEALVRASGIISKAAADLGMSRQALYRRMVRLEISLERRLRPQ